METEISPPCRVCGSNEHVVVYPDDHAQTVCINCCPKAEHADGDAGHQFDYARGEGWTCRYCGISRNDTDYGDD